jgi:hypothetical protein
VVNKKQMHQLRNLLVIILLGIEAGQLEHAFDAAKRMAAILDTCHPDSDRREPNST